MRNPDEKLGDRTQGRTYLPDHLIRVNDAAKRSRQTRFTALLHHIDVEALERAFRRLRRKAAPGVDGMTVEIYEGRLADNLRELCDRVHSGRYNPLPVRRTYIPKADGGKRPLGILVLEDKIVQGAVAEVHESNRGRTPGSRARARTRGCSGIFSHRRSDDRRVSGRSDPGAVRRG